MRPGPTPLLITPAGAAERPAALRLVFQGLSDLAVRDKLRHAEDMIRTGELDPQGVWLARDGTGVAAAMIAAPIPGGGAVVWPPRARVSHANADPVLDELLQAAMDWLRARGHRLAQAMLSPGEELVAAPLVRHGFTRITRLLYLRHFLDLSAEELAHSERLTYVTFDEHQPAMFHETLARSYAGSMDCPELNGRRSPAEVLAGHRGAGPFDPSRWWVAVAGSEPVGLLLMNAPEPDTWDIAYLGVVPEARRRGAGRELVRRALFEAKAAGMTMVTLAVDERNAPARALYRAGGFEPFDERIVYLAVLSSTTDGRG
jgi:ribosomal protein S18 acetylase RimI-like enzyme